MLCAARNQCCTRCWPARRAAVPAAVPMSATPIGLPSLTEIQSADIPTLKHVPLRARTQWARALRVALGEVERQKSHDAVAQLMMLPKCCLSLPASGRGGRKHRKRSGRSTLARLARWADGERTALFRDAPRAGRRARGASNAEAAARARADRAEQLARDGLWSKAAAALLDVGVADASDATRAELERLHPQPHDSVGAFPCGEVPLPPPISAEDILGHLRGFPRGTAPGPSGLRVQHLLDALVSGEEEALAAQWRTRLRLLSIGLLPEERLPR